MIEKVVRERIELPPNEDGPIGWVGVDGYADDSIYLEVQDHSTFSGVPNSATVVLTPGQAVRISRALVKAAGEALGVTV